MQQPQNQGLYRAEHEHDACGIGAVANISGERNHAIIEYGKEILENLHHRGAAGSDEITGDGAGILTQIPHDFFKANASGFDLPENGTYGVGMIFEPKDKSLAADCEKILEASLIRHGLSTIGWRDVPADNSCLGKLALIAEPNIRQIFIDGAGLTGNELETQLYLTRKRTHRLIGEQFADAGEDFYIVSMSARTICYKGMFMAWQLFAYYPDLTDKMFKSALAIVHQRYSTNTFPNWKLAQPFRMIAHNGEINTLSGNRNCATSRESRMRSDILGDDLEDLKPILAPNGSDSACFDNMLELLVRAGRSLPHSMMMMVPEAFGSEYHISRDKRAFYEYHASIMEPWDGPAAMLFTDGRYLGGTLDRNGLRPGRYLLTTDGLAVVASETGVVNFPTERIQQKGRLRPGRMFLIDTEEGRVITDNEVKSKIARQKPYRRWLDENRIELRGLFDTPSLVECDEKTLTERLRIFGYTREELSKIITPMAANGQEPIGSMGNDAPLAVLSDKSNLLFNYFKQRFAQVTNPPIDPLREGLVMSLMMFTGKRRNILDESPLHCRQLKLPHPILTNDDLNRLRNTNLKDFTTSTVDALFEANTDNPENALKKGLDRLVDAAAEAVRNGACVVVLSDVNATQQMAPIPCLLATSAVHQGLLERGLRSDAGIFVESGEPREVMHFCLLSGYGANAINPYVVFQTIHNLYKKGEFSEEVDPVNLANNYITAVKKGILKTMSKMGISTLRSYHTAQLFEAIGLNNELLGTYFGGTTSTIEGIGLAEIAQESVKRHKAAFTKPEPGQLEIEYGGQYSFRHDGEHHLCNPTTVARLQHAVRFVDKAAYDEFAHQINDQSRKLSTLRGLFEFEMDGSVPLEEVESADQIVRRFCTGAMSHGSISKEAHECMAIAMNRIGGMSNTGEGGEDPERYTLDANGDNRNCAIKQIASGRFGVTINYLANAKEIQIKMAQGAKPGEGGQLPGKKVTEEIARLRFSTPGVTLISPPPHHDIYSIEDLAQLIYDLKCSNPGVKVSVKLVSEVGVGTVAAGVAKGNADEVLISGHDGGTGASPLSSIKHAGCPWEIGLAEAQQVLVLNGLRDRIRVQADGQLKTGRDVVVAALLGAEQFGFGTSVLMTMGCTLLRKCHEGTCHFGIATQDPELRKRFAGKPEYIVRYMYFIAEEVRSLMAQMGFRKFDEMVGRVDKLKLKRAIEHYKAKGLDFSKVFYQPDVSDGRATRRTTDQAVKIDDHIDWKIIEQAKDAIENGKKMKLELPIRNTERTVGAILSNRIVKRHGPAGLPDDTLQIDFTGSAGQSFGAFLIKGVTAKLFGDCNDYLGKGLSGGRIIVETPESPYLAHENIAAGNTILYGATSGEVFINGMAGERFAVRNSGATAVVEGVGDHGCEYMTGGTVVVIGKTGRNFAAGMSGGIAYVFDDMQLFDTLCNLDMVELETVWREKDKQVLRDLIERHAALTDSTRARRILRGWVDMVGKFVKVMPVDYRKALEKMRANERTDTETTPATEEVFNG